MIQTRWLSLATLCLLATSIQLASGANILALLAFASKSHKAVFTPMVEELARRGHEVTIVSPHRPPEGSKNPGVREIVDPRAIELYNKANPPFQKMEVSVFQFWNMMLGMSTPFCEFVYTNPEFQELLKDQSKKYDVILVDGLFNDCMLPIVHHFQAPFIYVSTCSPPSWILEAIGAPNAFSFVPEIQGTYTSHMNFRERLNNVWQNLLNIYYRKFVLLPYWNEFAKKHLPNTPDIREIERNVSFVLTNTHPSITYQFPSIPGISEVGGMHCKPPKPLPQDLEDFINGSGVHGFIIISFGSVLRGADIPVHLRNMFVSAFSRISQRVIWKWETDQQIEGLSGNVRLVKWLPQQDLLGHEKIKAFITHGGLLSTQESVYHGCPLIGLPVFGDQNINLAKAARDGYAIHLTWENLSEERIYDAIQKVVNDSSFSATVKRLSRYLKDQPETPVQRAVYWTEYVIRHQGAAHLRSAARDLNIFQLYMIDIILFVVAEALVLIAALVFIVWKLKKRFSAKPKSQPRLDTKKNR